MKTNLPRILASSIIAASLACLAHEAQAQTAYAIANTGRSLIQFDLATPGTTTLIGNFTGSSLNLDGLDFRPADGLLYGYSRDNSIVTINPATAATTLVSTPSTASTSTALGIDFNPVADRMRLVNADDQNLRINVATGAAVIDGGLAYSVGDPNFGANPVVLDVAYTNSDNDPGTSTALYYIDYGLDILASTSNPNAGALSTVGPLGVDSNAYLGFDIYGATGAYAILSTGSQTPLPSLYSINLNTGAATLIGAVGGESVYGLAIVPAEAVPEPATNAAIVGLVFAGLAAARHWRQRAGR